MKEAKKEKTKRKWRLMLSFSSQNKRTKKRSKQRDKLKRKWLMMLLFNSQKKRM